MIGAPALLRFFGFAEPSAAILGALAAICFAMPLDVAQITSVLDFGRIGSEYSIIFVLTVIASLLAGCNAAPRANRPLGWYAQGDAGFIGALLVAIVLGANSFGVAIVNILIAALVIGVALWLAMTGAGALIGRGSSAAVPVASMWKRIGIGILAVVLIIYPSVPAVLVGIMTPSEAFTFFSLPIAAVLRLVTGLMQGRRMAGYGTDVLRGIADGAWRLQVLERSHQQRLEGCPERGVDEHYDRVNQIDSRSGIFFSLGPNHVWLAVGGKDPGIGRAPNNGMGGVVSQFSQSSSVA